MSLVVSLILLVFCVLVLYQLSRGAAFVPSHMQTVERIISLSQIRPGMKVADIGSGDGRIVKAFAEQDAIAMGFEINPILVWFSRWKIRQAGLDKKAQIIFGDFWKADFSQFDVVVLFGIDYIMARLGKKLLREMKPGSIVISNAFEFPGWTKSKSNYGISVYEIKKQAA